MKNNSNWFESPLPNSFNFATSLIHQDPEPEESQINRNLVTPTPFPRHPLSPFMPFPHEVRTDNGPLPANFDVPAIQDRVIFSDEQSDSDKFTPVREDKQKQQICTTGRKSINQRVHVLRKSRPKQKGLRGLSSRAYKAVLQMRNTTYKLVADRLIKELNLNPVLDNRENEETNVKRRVYDALNVLIAVGVIRKDGRAIVSEKSFGGKSRNRQEDGELLVLQKKLTQKREMIQEKEKKLRQAQQKFQGATNLLRRNRQNYDKVHADNSFVSFPFIGVEYEQKSKLIEVIGRESVLLTFSEKVHPFGDTDSLRWL